MSETPKYLQGLHDRFNYIASRISSINLKIDAKNPKTVDQAIAELTEVVKDLNELQEYQRSLPGGHATNTSGDIRNSIGPEVDALTEVKILYYMTLIYFIRIIILYI